MPFRHVEQEPGQQHEPESAKQIPLNQNAPEPPGEQSIGHQSTTGHGRAHALAGIPCHLPHERPQHTATVQREPGNEVEHRHHQVDHGKPAQADSPGLGHSQPGKYPERKCQHKTHGWPGDGDPELILGAFTVLIQLGDSAEYEQRDCPHRHPPPDGHQAVAQFMGDDRGKKRKRSKQRSDHGLTERPGRELIPQPRGHGEQQQREDDQPARVKLDTDTPDVPKGHHGTEHTPWLVL